MRTSEDKVGRENRQQKSRGWESNPQPTVYKTVALPIELPRRHILQIFYILSFFLGYAKYDLR